MSITESRNLSKCREVTVGCPSPADTPMTQLLQLRSREPLTREDGKVVRVERPGCLLSKCVFYIGQESYIHELSIIWFSKQDLYSGNAGYHTNMEG